MALPAGLWEKVYQRDRGRCLVSQLAPEAGPCRNPFGDPIRTHRDGTHHRSDLTFAHIKMAPGGPRRDDEQHGVMVCWGHHVFGEMYATSEAGLEKIRGYLRDRYGWDYE